MEAASECKKNFSLLAPACSKDTCTPSACGLISVDGDPPMPGIYTVKYPDSIAVPKFEFKNIFILGMAIFHAPDTDRALRKSGLGIGLSFRSVWTAQPYVAYDAAKASIKVAWI